MEKTSKAFQEAAGNINIAGTNIGALTTKLTSFANPATAAVAIVGALGAAYARSTIGAKDLEFAQNQLAASTTILTNSFAGLISSSEDGQGFVTNFLNAVLFRLSPQLQAQSKLLAGISEDLEDLGRAEIETRDKVNQRLADNQELLTEIQSDQTKFNDKLFKADEIITNIRRSEEELVDLLGEELGILQIQLGFDEQNEKLQTLILQKKREISNVEKDAEKRVQAIVRLTQNLQEAENKRLETARLQRIEFEKANTGADLTSDVGFRERTGGDTRNQKQQKPDTVITEGTLAAIDDQKFLAQAFATIEKGITRNKEQEARQRAQITKAQTDFELSVYRDAAGAIAGIFKEGSDLQAAFALIALGIDTAEAIGGLISASENNPGNAYTFGAAGTAQFVAGLARIITNVATATSYISQAAGGGDFVTKGPAMLMVGDNPGGVERVTVEPISGKGQTKIYGPNLMAMAGGGSITTTGNPGGLLSNTLTAETNQTILMANMMKRTPAPVVAVRDIRRQLKNVEVKDKVSRAQ